MRVELPPPPLTTPARTTARLVLAGAMIFAGLSHLFWGREEFRTPVPTSVPMDADGVGMATGGVEIALGVGLALLTPTGGVLRSGVPGNTAQCLNHGDGFGRNGETEGLMRLLFQPVVVAWSLCSAAATKSRR